MFLSSTIYLIIIRILGLRIYGGDLRDLMDLMEFHSALDDIEFDIIEDISTKDPSGSSNDIRKSSLVRTLIETDDQLGGASITPITGDIDVCTRVLFKELTIGDVDQNIVRNIVGSKTLNFRQKIKDLKHHRCRILYRTLSGFPFEIRKKDSIGDLTAGGCDIDPDLGLHPIDDHGILTFIQELAGLSIIIVRDVLRTVKNEYQIDHSGDLAVD